MMNPTFLQAANAALSVVLTAWVLLFVHYVGKEFSRCLLPRNHRDHVTWREARRSRAAAIAVMLFLLGDLLIRVSVWAWQHYQLPSDHPLDNVVLSIGIVTCLVGGTCGLRHFSPYRIRHLFWIPVPAIGIALGVWMAWQ